MKRRKVAILGGSFDPVHSGHLMLASYVAQFCGPDEVWLSLSPANPFKVGKKMGDDEDRRRMLELAVGDSRVVKFCDIELSMPRPSYMIDTLRALRKLHPDCDFCLLIGSDNYARFDKWKESESILTEFGLMVYPRPGFPLPERRDGNVRFISAPEIEISSTFIRDAIEKGKDMNFFMPPGVYSYIKEHNLYTEDYGSTKDS